MIDSLIKKRIFIAFSSLVIILASIYGYHITKQRQTALENGKIIKVKITREDRRSDWSKNPGVTFFFRINDKEYDAGEAIRGYENYKVGDSIEVYYIDNSIYAAQKNRKIYSFSGYFVFEISAFFIGLILLILSPFSKEKANKINSEKFLWPKGKRIDTNNLDRYFSVLMRNPNFMLKIDASSITLLNQNIKEIFNESPKETIDYVEILLKHQDFKLDYIYFGLIDSDLFKNKFFDVEFKKVFSNYLKNPSSYYEQILQTFLLSSHFDTDEKIRTEILNLIKSSFSKLDNKSVKRLKKIIKTCT